MTDIDGRPIGSSGCDSAACGEVVVVRGLSAVAELHEPKAYARLVRYFSRAWFRGYYRRLIITLVLFIATIGLGALAIGTPWHWLLAVTIVPFLGAMFTFFGLIAWVFRPVTGPPADEVPDPTYAARMRKLEEDLLGPGDGSK